MAYLIDTDILSYAIHGVAAAEDLLDELTSAGVAMSVITYLEAWQRYGIDSGAYSFPYVARWAEDRSVLSKNLSAIQRVAGAIIDGLEGHARRPGDEAGASSPDRG